MDRQNQIIQLQRGQALVLVGPQGCGKSRIARDIAGRRGSFVEIDAAQLETARGTNDAVQDEPQTLIVEGLPQGDDASARVKAMLTSDTMLVTRRYGKAQPIKTPNFIFCTGDTDALHLYGSDRRFWVVSLGA